MELAKRNETALFDWNKVSIGTEAFHFFSTELLIIFQQSGTENETFLEMERQVSVGRTSQTEPPAWVSTTHSFRKKFHLEQSGPVIFQQNFPEILS